MSIKLSQEAKQKLLTAIKHFMAETMEQEIGDLKASFLLEFCLQEVGPVIYNRAISDAQSFMQEKLIDLESACYEPERGYEAGETP